jgi:hypothetical protein
MLMSNFYKQEENRSIQGANGNKGMRRWELRRDINDIGGASILHI